MMLAAEQYEQIVTQLRSERSRGRTSEHRASPRVGLRMKIRVIPCKTSVRPQVHTVWLRDVSVNGLGFLFHEPMPKSAYVVVVLPRSGGATLDMLFSVARCQALPNNQFSIGMKFERVITRDEIEDATNAKAAKPRGN